MEGWHVHLVIMATLLASIVLAEDFKTIAGEEYNNVTIIRVKRTELCLNVNPEFLRFISPN